MVSTDIERRVGRLENDMRALDGSMESQGRDLAVIKSDVGGIKKLLWSVLFAALAALITALVNHR